MTTTILETGTQSRDTRHVAGVMFRCCDCGECKPIQTRSAGTGYAVDTTTDKLICYACAGKRDAVAMERDGKAVLYLSHNHTGKNPSAPYTVGNWCGTLSFPVYGVRSSFHNFAGRDGRRDFWFTAFGREWHGVNIGDSQIARVRALKG